MEKAYTPITAKYHCTDSVSIHDQNTLAALGHPKITLPFTDATYILQFDGQINAGFDLTGIVPTLEGSTVVITLPEPTEISHETSDVQLVYEKENIANPLKAGEESEWIAEQKSAMLDRAVSLGLYDEAKTNA
ncbi:DUF4230 domain-containing protein [Paratractidigestivibacter sp.]|nr:DUF4230 domain-containing protein [Paratractidigestivibacter sp.]